MGEATPAKDVQPLAQGELTAGAAPAEAEQTPSPETARAIAEAVGRVGIHASALQIQEALAGQGVNVDLPQIVNVRNRMNQRSQTPTAPAGGESPPAARGLAEAGGPEMAELLKVKGWAQEVGGVQRLKELCDLLIRLQG